MREFRNPFKVISSVFAGQGKQVGRGTQALLSLADGSTSATKDGDEPAKKPKRARGISTQRSTLLTAGSAVGQETSRKSLLGVS